MPLKIKNNAENALKETLERMDSANLSQNVRLENNSLLIKVEHNSNALIVKCVQLAILRNHGIDRVKFVILAPQDKKSRTTNVLLILSYQNALKGNS
jgi:hypothetical protein